MTLPLSTLKAQIQEDVKTAMRARDQKRLTALRLITAAIKQVEVDQRIEMDDKAVLTVLDKMVKQRRDPLSSILMQAGMTSQHRKNSNSS